MSVPSQGQCLQLTFTCICFADASAISKLQDHGTDVPSESQCLRYHQNSWVSCFIAQHEHVHSEPSIVLDSVICTTGNSVWFSFQIALASKVWHR